MHSSRPSYYVDVHTHLTHPRFVDDWREVISRATESGLGAILVNGLDPQSNRQVLSMAQEFPVVRAALGIYPLDAVASMLPPGSTYRNEVFDVDQEIQFIREQARAGKLTAIGECGIDGYGAGPETFPEQERVFGSLIEIALECDLPLVIHTRKLEARAGEILNHYGLKRVNFHCFGGRTKLAQRYAEEFGWWFSIPANAHRNQAFAKMLANLPMDRILTETDAPYMPPIPETRNEPANVVGTIKLLAELRNLSVDDACTQVWNNYIQLFRS